MKSEFVKAFCDAKAHADKIKSNRGGYKIILHLVGWRLIPATVWEVLTTFMVYLPASDYHRLICVAVNEKWESLSDEKRQKVLASLLRLDSHGEITAIIG